MSEFVANGTETQRPPSSVTSRITRYGPLLVWLVFIFSASTSFMSGENTSRIIGPLLHYLFPTLGETALARIHIVIRKLGHLSEYAILAFVAARAFRGSAHMLLFKYWLLWTTVLLVVYALLDEYHQSFVPSRTASIYDSMIDVTGGLTCILIYWLVARARSAPTPASAGS
jgi:VanZ family protein